MPETASKRNQYGRTGGRRDLTDARVRTRAYCLLTNNPAKRAGLEGHGLRVVERVPLTISPTAENLFYLQTEQERFGHLLVLPRATCM